MYMYDRMEGQVYCLSVLACAHMHRARMCGSVPVWWSVAYSSWWCRANSIPTMSQSILQLPLMERDCQHSAVWALPASCSYVQHMSQCAAYAPARWDCSPSTQKCKTNNTWIVLSVRYRKLHQFSCVILASFVRDMGSNLCTYWVGRRMIPLSFHPWCVHVCTHSKFLHKGYQGLVFQFSVGDLVKE